MPGALKDAFEELRNRFENGGNITGSVINQGSIEAKLGGYIALLAPEVQNSGVLLAKSTMAV